MPTTEATGNIAPRHPLFVTTVALGAFLMFLIQPLAARSLLPAFGGSGSVWVTSLVFYQVLLAAGYFLTHFIYTHLTMRTQKTTLFLLSIGSLLTLSVLPKPGNPGSDLLSLRLLMSLATSVGPPFLLLAVAVPLVQGWAAKQGAGISAGRDVYSLFAISNGASLLALIGYPLVAEPLLGTLQQGMIWEGLFVVEVLLVFAISRRLNITSPTVLKPEKPHKQDRKTYRLRALLWLFWSTAGVMVLTSTSGYIAQEIVAIPLLWVIPLSLYLITWSLTFSGAIRLGVVACGSLALVAMTLMVLTVDFRLTTNWEVKLGLALTGMVLACFSIHATLYRQRPDKGQITHFYAAIAAGGAIGGILSGVVAIQVFQNWRDLALAFNLVALLACVGLIRHLLNQKTTFSPRNHSFWLVGMLLLSCGFLFVVTGMEHPGLLYKHRDFHGLVRVVEKDAGNPKRHRLEMYHGSTMHGNQMMHSSLRRKPTTYFGPGTGAEIAVQAQSVLTGEKRGLNIGVVGLGVGTMATYVREKDTMCFYELSPAVIELAQNKNMPGNSGNHFSYLSDAPGEIKIVPGDARLSLKSELNTKPGGNSYDLLVLDAFAGDSVPLHLLTQEAFSLFTKHITDTGMIAVHVSCNWLDLVPVVYAWADAERWQALTISTRGGPGGVSGNHAVWVLLFRDQTTLKTLAEQCRPLMAEGKIMVQNIRNISYGNLAPWTDNRSNLLALMRSKIRLRTDISNRPPKNSTGALQPASIEGNQIGSNNFSRYTF